MILFPKNLVASRPVTTLVKGQPVDGTPASVPFVGDIQPASNRDLVALQIGRQGLGKVKVYSDRALQTGSSSDHTLKGDLVTWGSKQYELIQENYHNAGLNEHWLYYAELRE
jgi:hypothetical protein